MMQTAMVMALGVGDIRVIRYLFQINVRFRLGGFFIYFIFWHKGQN
jgi:hypothetical protein